MKILHTADLHLGQVIYQNYDRSDEHLHFFRQLSRWCQDEQPDALVVCGDVFDIQQPSAMVKMTFNDYFVQLHKDCPQMAIVIIAGNHDSASRIQADNSVWQLANVFLIGTPPAFNCIDAPQGWQKQYIVRLDSGYIVALPYMSAGRTDSIQSMLDQVAADNTLQRPVVMMAHQAVAGLDPKGHDFEIGTIKTQHPDAFGRGYDYLALGHIHKPQTIGRPDHGMSTEACYPAPVIRYAGSALHVSCDETYPHTVSVVEIDRHGGDVSIRQLRIDEWRHFYVLPLNGASYASADEAIADMRRFVSQGERGYIRFRFDHATDLPSDFSQRVYVELAPYSDEWRYNPKIIWTGQAETTQQQTGRMLFEVAELQQMTDPMSFVERTIDQYPELDLDHVRRDFMEVEEEMKRLREEKQARKRKKDSSRAT